MSRLLQCRQKDRQMGDGVIRNLPYIVFFMQSGPHGGYADAT